jgi:hypothetical protein
MERETGIEPATNSLEGCDSTTELLPPCAPPPAHPNPAAAPQPVRPPALPPDAGCFRSAHFQSIRLRPPGYGATAFAQYRWPAEPKLATRAKAGGEGRIRTSEAARATDLQSAAFDRSATSPKFAAHERPYVTDARVVSSARLAARSCGLTRCDSVTYGALPCRPWPGNWSWRRDLNPRPADYKSAALPD